MTVRECSDHRYHDTGDWIHEHCGGCGDMIPLSPARRLAYAIRQLADAVEYYTNETKAPRLPRATSPAKARILRYPITQPNAD
jgi:hypothetical protein